MSAREWQALMAVARRLQAPIERLDALLVPLANGMADSHGRLVARPQEVLDRLGPLLEAAGAGIRETREWLEREQERTRDAVQSGS